MYSTGKFWENYFSIPKIKFCAKNYFSMYEHLITFFSYTGGLKVVIMEKLVLIYLVRNIFGSDIPPNVIELNPRSSPLHQQYEIFGGSSYLSKIRWKRKLRELSHLWKRVELYPFKNCTNIAPCTYFPLGQM